MEFFFDQPTGSPVSHVTVVLFATFVSKPLCLYLSVTLCLLAIGSAEVEGSSAGSGTSPTQPLLDHLIEPYFRKLSTAATSCNMAVNSDFVEVAPATVEHE